MERGIRGILSRHRVASVVVAHIGVLAMVGMLLFGSGLGTQVIGAFAHSPCPSGDQAYVVVRGNTLSGIAARYNTTWQKLASYNRINNPNLIYIQQTVCIPGHSVVQHGPPPMTGRGNYFPYGQCTWWAAQRYFQMHHIYVPWTTQSNAWEWTARAYDFHWKVSTRPSVGAIVDLQPWVEGAYGLGHVAVVERVLSNGYVIASNMNWGFYYWRVVDVEFAPGPGVTFLSV
jgi:N-acetylmuramoyl-L-alanine amidase